ncbi:MAG: SPOR domain-containing protein [Deltaproteobacteria bacterium]|nr:SPOR domain-containing protein [Deltaproteobacteria bacterium]
MSSKNGSPKLLVELKDLEKGEFTIQVGAFKDKENAFRLADRLKVLYKYINIARYVDKDNRAFFRVHVSKSKTLTQAGKIEKKLEDMGLTEAFIVRI